jgi:hypothetical protein
MYKYLTEVKKFYFRIDLERARCSRTLEDKVRIKDKLPLVLL